MANVVRREIIWCVTEEAARDLEEVREALGDGYKADVALLQEKLCLYFSAKEGCSAALGKSINPIGSTPDGGKMLKVRWMVPGCGSSGGLRIAFAVYCDSRRVVLCRSWMRKEDPGDEQFGAAGRIATRYRIK